MNIMVRYALVAALLNVKKHNVKLVIEDAAKRFPSILKWWDKKKEIYKEDIGTHLLF